VQICFLRRNGVVGCWAAVPLVQWAEMAENRENRFMRMGVAALYAEKMFLVS
jgi:hypothetical protein